MGNGPLRVPPPPVLSAVERQRLLSHAHVAITAAVESTSERSEEALRSVGITGPLAATLAVFVSVYYQANLRGCIGLTKATRPLWHSVAQMAAAAATRDARFAPLDRTELDDLAIEVSVLGPFMEVPPELRDPLASFVELGEHGARLQKGRCSALFLPHVPTRFGWSGVEFLDQLARKAELNPGVWLEDDARLELFRVTSFGGPPLA